MIKLRDYQRKAVEAPFDFWKENPDGHPVIGAPTGAGKSYIIAGLIQHTLRKWPNTKILVVSHTKEIVSQDAKAIENLTRKKVGIYSAGLGRKEKEKITVAGIQSIYKKARDFAGYKFIIIDECHSIPLSGDGRYRTFISGLPEAKYLGLSATLFRLGGGYVYGEGKIFTGIAYDLTSKDKFRALVKEGYLSELKTVATNIEFETKTVRTQNGDFKLSDMSDQFDRTPITNGAIKEIIKHGKDYKKWLIFAIDIKHAEHIAETLIRNDIMAAVVHSEMEDNRDDIIRKFKNGIYTALVNVNILTTGFDDPEIDLIALLRPTKSPVLHVQMVGRGLRISPGKDHCLVLDFGGNTNRLGPIDDVHVAVKRKGTGGGEPITKTCPDCNTIHHPAVRICPFCNHRFKFKHGLQDSSGKSVITNEDGRWYEVTEVRYDISKKINRPDLLLITYVCGIRVFKDFINLNHNGYAKVVAKHKLKIRGGDAETVEEAYERRDELLVPNRIKVREKKKYPEIVDLEF